jgi:ubiquinone/menaquinone biosynthesis C-methylase UbiE
MATAAEAWQGYKARSFALLELAEGDQVLEVGCGTGEDARELARLVRGVAVVGVDASERAVAEAQARTLGVPRPVEFRLGDAHRLEVEDGAFDACRADKVFHHLADPRKALAEMVRVARPGARIVVSDADYETLVVDAPDRALTRRILNAFCDGLPDGWLGRQLPALLEDAGLLDVEVFPYTAIVRHYDEELLRLREKAEGARKAGVVSAAESVRWIASLEEADHVGRFLCALTVLTVRGRTL